MKKDLQVEIKVEAPCRPSIERELVGPGFKLAASEGFRSLGAFLNHLLRKALEKGKK